MDAGDAGVRAVGIDGYLAGGGCHCAAAAADRPSTAGGMLLLVALLVLVSARRPSRNGRAGRPGLRGR
jgi:MYXO-CTERM domain-containing protein